MVVEPATSVKEAVMEVVHNQVNGSSMGIADEATVAVTATVERQRGVTVVMKRTECLVVAH